MNWQPIETAPKGVEVLTWSYVEGASVAKFRHGGWAAIAGWSVHDGDGDRADSRELTPTHWMHLPEKPA